jgi:hypothetical protein
MYDFNKLGKGERHFVCDACGQEYDFTGSWMTIRQGQEYKGAFWGQIHGLATALMDLCRDCSGQDEKLRLNNIGPNSWQGEIDNLDQEIGAAI